MAFGKDIGIDLGTASVLIYVKGKGIVLSEPSVVAIDKNTGKLLKVGADAQAMLGRTPGNIIAIRPLREGVISDYEVTERMLKEFIHKVAGFQFFKPRIIICVPSGITEVEERAVIDAGIQAGARRVYLIEEPVAAAIGAGIDITQPDGHFIIDIGGGTSEVAVIALGNIASKKSVQVAGDKLNSDIKDFMRREHNLDIGIPTAEQIKINVGAAITQLDNPPSDYEVYGRDLVHGIPRSVMINYQEIATALNNSINSIEDAVMQALNVTPPELSADIFKTGIYLAGGGSLLRGLDKRINKITQLPVHVVDDPLRAVARGTAIALKNIDKFESLTKY